VRIDHVVWDFASRRFGAWLAVALLGGALLLGIACSGSSSDSAAKLTDPNKTGSDLVNKYITLLQQKDVDGLKTFLSDAFLIQRADGSTSEKADYLQNYPDIGEFTITNVTATQAANALIVRWDLTVHEVIDGKPYDTAPAPRLSTFYYSDGKWQLTSHANFNAPEGAPPASPTTN
jgi:hypothetical protein